jgi:hypothetical protein
VAVASQGTLGVAILGLAALQVPHDHSLVAAAR